MNNSSTTPVENKVNMYLGLEGPVLLCAVLHMFESSQIVVADGGRLETNRAVTWKRTEESAGRLFVLELLDKQAVRELKQMF